MAYIAVGDEPHKWHALLNGYSTLMLLFSDYSNIPQDNGVPYLPDLATYHAFSVFEVKLRLFLPSSASESDQNLNDHLLDTACDTMLASLAPMLVGFTDGSLERAFISSVSQRPFVSYDVKKALVRWFSRTRGIRFVTIAIQEPVKQNFETWSRLNVLDHLTTFKVSPNPEEDSRLLVLEIGNLVSSIPGLHVIPYWFENTVKLPFCIPREDCDGFCFFADSIIKLLEKARSLVVQLPFADVETLGVTWEALSLALAPATEDTVARSVANTRWYERNATTIEHLNEVRTCILEAFRPFFESISRSG